MSREVRRRAWPQMIGGVELHGHEADGLVGAGEAVEEGDEQAGGSPGVLVGDEADEVAATHELGMPGGRRQPVEQGEAALLAGGADQRSMGLRSRGRYRAWVGKPSRAMVKPSSSQLPQWP